jgi:hypothetical protein
MLHPRHIGVVSSADPSRSDHQNEFKPGLSAPLLGDRHWSEDRRSRVAPMPTVERTANASVSVARHVPRRPPRDSS